MAETSTSEFRSHERVTVVAESGIRTGPGFILLHGIGMGRHYWGALTETLGEHGRVYALDLPGFGDAPEPEDPLEMHQAGDLIAELVDSLGIEDPVLVGHSMGSQVAVEAAARHPEVFTRVVLISPTVNPEERGARIQALRLVQDLWGARLRVLGYGFVYYVKAGPRWYFKTLRKMMNHRVEDTLPRVQADTLVIRGSDDLLCPRGWVDRIVGTVPLARLVEVPGTGHEVMMTNGHEVGALIAGHAEGRG
ncbi:alpha/beta hydrolase [Mycetocola manganoxydans]|uniref:Alpha/beta hydrolase n=1 Tax=Mycetocola manganoxydans TaxID=699879 RepID=A0A3L6ZTY7_9MICO|nr:alpha/beta hydrolase [Mycetocola manganoxydans]RLP71453.1 alpha/beta hydrolase [Mycetocola manganoxydans]GHD46579.1 alpha/beta hydrolase [Mycetocola manganoxydans]